MRENGERESGASGEGKEGDDGDDQLQAECWRKSQIFQSKVVHSEFRKGGKDNGYGTQNLGTQFTYRDKLLSLGESGFLEINMSAYDALNGWKDHLAKLGSKNIAESEEKDEEELDANEKGGSWQQGGKYPKLKFTAEEYESWCKPYMNSLIVKLLGKSFRVGFMRQRMERVWNPKSPMKITPMNNGYYIVSFSIREDRDYALLEGPWMIADHYLMVQRWRPNFNPWKADHQKKIAAWVHFPDLPVELYNIESLRRLGDIVGKTLKIDRTTAFSEKGGFARICVELDLQKPLLPFFNHFGEDRRIEYKGLHLVCFHCGQYGHHMGICSHKNPDQPPEKVESGGAQGPITVTGEERSISGKSVMDAEEGGSKGGKFGPHMLVKREFSRSINNGDGVGSSSNNGVKKVVINQKATQKGNVHRGAKDAGKRTEKKDEREGFVEEIQQLGW